MTRRGIFTSDFHMFSDRSVVESILPNLEHAAGNADLIVLGGDIVDFERFVDDAVQAETPGVNTETRRRLALSYGTAYSRVLQALWKNPADRAPLGASCDVTRGEVRHAVREEAAVRLSDAVMRRTEAGSAGHPGNDELRSAAEVMADELGWNRQRIDDEIADVERLYDIPA